MATGLQTGGAGRCQCGRVSYAFDDAPLWQAHCHCESCRRAGSVPFTSYLGVRDGHWRWTGAAPASHASSPGVTGFFCTDCGAPMGYASTAYPGETHFFAASLADPADFAPSVHVHWDERLPWVRLGDGLKVVRAPASSRPRPMRHRCWR